MVQRKGLILIIEDKPDWLRKLAKACEKAGYSVRRTDNYDKAASLLTQHDFDAIVADIRLVDWQEDNIQGLQVLGVVPPQNRPATVVVTAYPNWDHVRLAFKDYQVSDLMVKSEFKTPTFLRAVAKAVGTTRAKRSGQ